jgi:hypothetical protein
VEKSEVRAPSILGSRKRSREASAGMPDDVRRGGNIFPVKKALKKALKSAQKRPIRVS